MSSIAANALPHGLRDIKITPIDAAGDYGTMIDLPVSQTLSWTDSADFSELRGDDELQAERESGQSVDWDMAQGGISLEAYAAIAGGTVGTSGVAPNTVKTYGKASGDARPYFRIDGQVISDNGGDVHLVIYRAKATGDIGGEFSEGEFEVTSMSGRGYPSQFAGDEGKVYDLVHNQTAAAITQPA